MKIRLQKDWSTMSWEIYAVEQGGGQVHPYRMTMEVLPPVPRHQHIEPAIRLDMNQSEAFIAALLEGLAEAGLIPKMGATEAELTATKRHLEDMRAMAFEEVKPAPKLN